jgi:hypothetical protein
MTSDPGDGDSTPLCEPGQLELPRLTSIATEAWWAGEAGLLWNVEHHIGDRP